MSFKIGTAVQFKSGDPEMTVKGIIGDSNNPINKTLEKGLKKTLNENDENHASVPLTLLHINYKGI